MSKSVKFLSLLIFALSFGVGFNLGHLCCEHHHGKANDCCVERCMCCKCEECACPYVTKKK